jgi:aspartyl/asparaginyl-tRNA synthetase
MSHQPVNTWGLDAQFSSFRKLLIGHLKALKIVQHGMCFEYYLANRSIQQVEVMGYVVSKRVMSKKVVLYLDDGSGVVQCAKFYDESDYEKSLPFANVNLGDVVSIRGRIVMFQE